MVQKDGKPGGLSKSTLPYSDVKPAGAAGFYLGVNATFRFVHDTYGAEALRQYWQDLGNRYFAPVSKIWSEGGLTAVGRYWREFFRAEPGAEVAVAVESDRVIVQVAKCPAIQHLRNSQREIMPDFCEHCYWVSRAIGQPSGISVVVRGGNGTCRQEFFHSCADEVQKLEEIARCS